MANELGPWGEETPGARRGDGRARAGIWLCLAGALAVLVAALVHAFPEALRGPDGWAALGYRAGVLAVVSAGIFRGGRLMRREHLAYVAIWAAVIAVVALGFAYRQELAGVPEHLRLAFNTGDPVRTGDHELVVPQDENGGFVLVGQVNGRRVRFLVDTGATDTVLSPDDARDIGLDMAALRYVAVAETANGQGYGAPIEASRIEVGPIAFDRFRMVVNQAPMSTSLLGLSFLDRLESFQVKDHKLILRWREPNA